MSDDDQRSDRRVTINKEFESFDAFIHEYVTNISKTGAFIRSQSPLPIGTPVNLRFTVIMDDIETIEGAGRVVRVEEDPPGMGVVFTELGNYSRGLIGRLLTQQVGSKSLATAASTTTEEVQTDIHSSGPPSMAAERDEPETDPPENRD